MKTKIKLESISSGQSLLSYFYRYFSSLPDPRGDNIDIPLQDALMSAYAMFSLKFPSILKFDERFKKGGESDNLQSMFGVEIVPSDTQMRTIIDDIPTQSFNGIYNEMFRKIQRDKKLEPYEFIKVNGVPHYLMIADGTEFFSSKNVCCPCCNVKTHKKTDKITGEIIETKSYHHQMLNAVIAHPDIKTVIPLPPEPITKQDGSKKCDCELNALKRFLERFRKDHPKLKVIFVADALYATGSLIRLLKRYDMKFILNVKPGKNKTLFSIVNTRDENEEVNHHSYREENGIKIKKDVSHKYRFINEVPIDNDSSLEFKINFLEYWEDTNWINTKREECEQHRHFSWATDIILNKNIIETVMKGGRARWCIDVVML